MICGRGGKSLYHKGNIEYRAVITANKERYIKARRNVKQLLVKSVVDAVRLLNPPGRFLELDNDTGFWYDIGDKRAFAKVSVLLVFMSLFYFLI